jgi:hypothetical protein
MTDRAFIYGFSIGSGVLIRCSPLQDFPVQWNFSLARNFFGKHQLSRQPFASHRDFLNQVNKRL